MEQADPVGAEGEPGAEARGASDSSRAPALPSRQSTALALLVSVLLFGLWGPSVSMARSWGWDESMHTELPAARMLLALQAGAPREAAEVLQECQQYPFGYPAFLALVQACTGVSEHAARMAGRGVWCLGLFGLFLLGRELARAAGASRQRESTTGWLALWLGAASPLALAYSGMLFQEGPFLVVSIFALRAWLRRQGAVCSRRRELAAGAWLTAAFFTRFNTGVLLGLGAALDLGLQAVLAVRTGALRAFLRRALWLALVPALAFAWWFLLPLPGGLELGAQHRHAFWEFLWGNRDPSMDTRVGQRVLDWTCFFAFTPRVLVLMLLGLGATLRVAARPGARSLWIVLLATGLPVWTHNFHQDRFLLPPAAALWPLAALGLARLLPTRTAARWGVALAAFLAVALFPGLDRGFVFEQAIGFKEPLRAYQQRLLDEMQDLSGDRPLATNGLARAEHAAVLAALAAEIGPDESVGWIGISTRLSPAALHLGLLDAGGSAERFRRETARRIFVTIEHVDHDYPPAQIAAWAEQFDVVIATDPIDLGGDKKRAFLAKYRDQLVADPRWTARALGEVGIANPLGKLQPVQLYACRRP